MTDFKELQLGDRELFNSFLKDYSFGTYEYAFSTLYIWRKMCRVYHSVIQDALIVKKDDDEKGQSFMAPIGYREENLKLIIEDLLEMKKEIPNMPYLFRDVEEDFLAKLTDVYGEKVKYVEDDGNFDYIYDTEELISLSGKKFHSKKNHFNSFITSYSYNIKDINEHDTAEECIKFAGQWLDDKTGKTDELMYEVRAIEELINNRSVLNIEGMAVYADGVMAGFTLGERLNDNMVVIHIEKGDNNFRGIYAFLNKVFLDKYFSDVKYVNRQEDVGIKGLRMAKMSYHPVKLEKKYNVNIEV
ncbi:MAG: phosphatidylglycerol lysyltransferase domain-containing protein [Bacillota bacterium]|nr:phosphatidylglycerol lysyltransferase domain-containing protein [Bacillota bacterium]